MKRGMIVSNLIQRGSPCGAIINPKLFREERSVNTAGVRRKLMLHA